MNNWILPKASSVYTETIVWRSGHSLCTTQMLSALTLSYCSHHGSDQFCVRSKQPPAGASWQHLTSGSHYMPHPFSVEASVGTSMGTTWHLLRFIHREKRICSSPVWTVPRCISRGNSHDRCSSVGLSRPCWDQLDNSSVLVFPPFWLSFLFPLSWSHTSDEYWHFSLYFKGIHVKDVVFLL